MARKQQTFINKSRCTIKFKYLIMGLFLVMPSYVQAQIDSLSYALGHESTLGLLAGKNDLMTNEHEFREYIRGLKDNLPRYDTTDSTFLINYSLGAMQGIFLTDSFTYKSKEEWPPVDCIMEGLRKVADDKLTLPEDTIKALAYIDRFPSSKDPMALPESDRCRFFTAYGIMKGFQPGLKQYIEEMTGKHDILANRSYYARGMMDALSFMQEPGSAYDLGKMMGCSLLMGFTSPSYSGHRISADDYIDGAEAALQLSLPKIDKDEIEQIMALGFSQQVTQTTRDIDGLMAIPGEPYEVSWSCEVFSNITAGGNPEEVDNAIKAFVSALLRQGMELEPLDNDYLLYKVKNLTAENVSLLQSIYNGAVSSEDVLPDGYKYVCGRIGDGNVVVGIVRTGGSFKSNVDTAVLSVFDYDGFSVPEIHFHFGDSGNYIQKAKEWADFTETNIGKTVVMEINGEVVAAPRVNSEITSGACAVTGLPVHTINNLFGMPALPLSEDSSE